MDLHLNCLILFICIGFTTSLFVPEQLTTVLSFIYSNIPPVTKGTDSRVGFGFSLGRNADFQVLFELGPQQYTLPIGGTPTSASKRETVPSDVIKNPNWLQLWKQQATNTGNDKEQEEYNNNIPGALDEDVINHLKQLYREQPKYVVNENLNVTETNSNSTEGTT